LRIGEISKGCCVLGYGFIFQWSDFEQVL